MSRWEKEIEEAASILSRATRAVAFCGAGVSAESDIATFRDPGGLWDRIDPMEMGTSAGLVNALAKNAAQLMPIFFELLDSFEKAKPNPGHIAMSELEKMLILKYVITQNVDNLHSEAGNTQVIEVHGNLFRMRCLSCGSIKNVERVPFIQNLRKKLSEITEFTLTGLAGLAPTCSECGFMMRPDVVMFGEAVQDLTRASQASREADAMLVLGTSGVVYPAAYFPVEARGAGAKIIVINPTENSFVEVTDVYIPMKTGEALPAIVDRIKQMAS